MNEFDLSGDATEIEIPALPEGEYEYTIKVNGIETKPGKLSVKAKATRPSPGRGINPSGRMMRSMERDAEARIARALNKMRMDLLRGLNESNVHMLSQKLGSREVLQPFADVYTDVIQDIALAGAEFGQEQINRFVFGTRKSILKTLAWRHAMPNMYARMDYAGIMVSEFDAIYRDLTSKGMEDEEAWGNALGAWLDQNATKRIDITPMVDINWELANTAAEDWARRKAGQDIVSIANVTRRRVQKEVSQWTTNTESLNQLRQRLSRPNGPFSPKRARVIAVTETTRAFAAGNQEAWEESGYVTGKRWNTSVDELVCPICGPLHNEIAKLKESFRGGLEHPPAHPNCRCWITPTVEGVEDLQTGLEQFGLQPTATGQENIPGFVDTRLDDFLAQQAGLPATSLDRGKYRRFDVHDKGSEFSNAEIEATIKETEDWARDTSYSGWHASLSDEEREWLRLYKQDGYEWINPALRGDDVDFADYGENAASFRKARGEIDNAVRRHRLTEDVTLWRGGSHPEIEAALKSGRKIEDLAGMVIGDDAYVSTSINSSSADKFLAWAGDSPVKFEIQAPRGTFGAYIEPMDASLEEYEYLLARGTNMKILEGKMVDGVMNILARIVT